MEFNIPRVLDSSRDPKELVRAAISLANSNDPANHALLLRSLTSESFLNRINTPEEYEGDATRLRVRRVLQALVSNQTPGAGRVVLALTNNSTFTAAGSRVEALIIESARIRPVTSELVSFWDRYFQPDDGFTPLTVRAITANGSGPALRLLEQKMADPAHEDDFKIAWMRSDILVNRNSPELLKSCERLLQGGLPARLRGDLVEAIFDYKPGVWYRPSAVPHPPQLSSYSTAARAQLRRIAEYALAHLSLSPEQKASIERTMKELDQ